MTFPRRDFDGVLVIGAGLAGLSAALGARPRRALVLIAVLALGWAIQRGSLIFAGFIALGALRAFAAAAPRAAARPLTADEWVAGVALYVATVSLCVAVTVWAAGAGGIRLAIPFLGARA